MLVQYLGHNGIIVGNFVSIARRAFESGSASFVARAFRGPEPGLLCLFPQAERRGQLFLGGGVTI